MTHLDTRVNALDAIGAVAIGAGAIGAGAIGAVAIGACAGARVPATIRGRGLMRVCPQCQLKYSDEEPRCFVDGAALSSEP
jgi:hypothetical protein